MPTSASKHYRTGCLAISGSKLRFIFILIKLLALVSAVNIYIYIRVKAKAVIPCYGQFICVWQPAAKVEIISTIDYVTKGFVGHHAVKFRQQVLFTVFISLLYRGSLYWGSTAFGYRWKMWLRLHSALINPNFLHCKIVLNICSFLMSSKFV